MEEIKDFDADSYKLDFESDTPEEERQFYLKKYLNFDLVAGRRLHCTTCNTHIGCAVANKATIRMHPILRVTHCKKCYAYYSSCPFRKGKDGSEFSCRWCALGGTVFCCSKCPYVFCKKCIAKHFPRGKINEIKNNDNWHCFSCSPKDIWDLRAQHWALVNYIKIREQKILSEEKDPQKINELMYEDPTSCCFKKKERKLRSKDVLVQRKSKRRSNSGCSSPAPKRIQENSSSAVLPKIVPPSIQQKTAATELDELVCGPDILSMFNEPADVPPPIVAVSKSTATVVQRTVPVAWNQKSVTSQPSPLIIRQLKTSSKAVPFRTPHFSTVRRETVVPSPAPPAYRMVNGFRVDLNAAAQQESFRLPNGKIIQVKKHVLTNQAKASVSISRGVQSTSSNTYPETYSIRLSIQPNFPAQPVQIQPTCQSLQSRLQQQQQFFNGMNSGTSSGMSSVLTGGMNSGMSSGMNTLPAVHIADPSASLELAQSHLETEIQKVKEICKNTDGKLNNLMNAYKNVRNHNDVKELHRDLSYLCASAMENFKTAQEKCIEDMKVFSSAYDAANKLADEKNKYTNVDDDLEVVEPTTVFIVID